MKASATLWAAIFLVCFSGLTPVTAITLLHEFAGGSDDGNWPFAGLTLSGSALYGTTFFGGDNNLGTVFSLNTDGSGHSLLHEFAGPPDEGWRPFGLTLSGSTLFGTTEFGPHVDGGTVFSLNTDGTGYAVRHALAGLDGNKPYGRLAIEGTTLYGTTFFGGSNDFGTVYALNTDGTSFSVLHEFAGGATDGSQPTAGLMLSGSTLFGATQFGGGSDRGTIFSMNADGTGFTLLHEFAGGPSDGDRPSGDLTLVGSKLFGTTLEGGDDGGGTIFSVDTDGTGFTLLHEFAGGANDGRLPFAGLALSDLTLFGTTQMGGDNQLLNEEGTVFAINTDGTGFELLHRFRGGANDGRRPVAGVLLDGATLFGTTQFGGDHDRGTVFALVVPEPGGQMLMFVSLCAIGICRTNRTRSHANNSHTGT